MKGDIIPYKNQLKELGLPSAPAIIEDAGDEAKERLFEIFFTTIRNKNTREAYARAVIRFLAWCDRHQLELTELLL